MALNQQTLVTLFLDKTDAALDTIAAQAESVALGGMTSISALSQSATFNTEDAGVILAAIVDVRRRRRANPDACADDVGGPTLGHSMRFQPVKPPPGTTWGC